MAYNTYGYNNYNSYGGAAAAALDEYTTNANAGTYNPRYHYQAAANAGFNLTNDDGQPRILYVGNLDPSVTEEFIATLFGQIGRIIKTKVIFDTTSDPYAFVEFGDHHSATQALQAMNRRMLLDKEMKVNWATQPGTVQKTDTSRMSMLSHFHVFVGDLSPEVDNKALRDAFVPFGDVSDAKVIRDPQTTKSKGYGFVSYPKREEAERAIEQMNGQWLGRRTIRTNWATRKPTAGGDGQPGSGSTGYGAVHHNRQSYEEIFSQAGPDNTSVYIGNIPANSTDDDVRSIFKRFGAVLDIRHFKTQGYSFVKFDSKESAAKAIHEMNGAEFMGQMIRCSWGKSDSARAITASSVIGGGGNVDPPPGANTGVGAYGQGAPPPGAGGLPGAPAGYPQGANAQQQQQYWQYYQHYYNNPAVQQQWQAYWSQAQRQGQPGGQPQPTQPQH